MRCHKVRRILRYHVPNKLLSSEKLAHHVLLLFYLFRYEKDLLSCFPPMYQNKLQEEQVKDVTNINKMKFEPCGDLVDQAFVQFNENLINNRDPYSQIENDETLEAEYPIGSDLEVGETNRTFALPNFMQKILPENEIAEGINSLNSK